MFSWKTLLALLEYELCEEDAKVKDEVIAALQGTTSGQRVYFEFCQQQLLIKVIVSHTKRASTHRTTDGVR